MRRAFTMLEMVVVIAILAVIAAVVFPVFGQAVSKARGTGCASNVRQVYLAAQLYRQDYGDYPRIMIDSPAFLPYFSGTILKCPAAKPDWPSYVVTASTAYGARERDDPKVRRYVDALIECRDRRGPDLPVVFDDNHSTKAEGYRTGEAFYLLARESGAIEQIPSSRTEAMFNRQIAMPCSPIVSNENL